MGVTIRFKSLPTRDLPFTLPLPPHIPIFLSHRSNTFPPSLTTFVNNPFSFIFFQISPFPFFFFRSSFHSELTASPTKLTHSRRWRWFARGQCYLNRPIGLFAIAPSIRQEALRNQPITSISHDSIQWIYNGLEQGRGMKSDEKPEREEERKRGTKRKKEGESERWSVRDRSQSSAAACCQWPLCDAMRSVLFVCGLKQTSDCWKWGDGLWPCLTVKRTVYVYVCVRLHAVVCTVMFLFEYLHKHTFSGTHRQKFTCMHLCVRVRVYALMCLLACVQREVVILSLFRG